MIRTLAERHAIDGHVQFYENPGGFLRAVLLHKSGARCELALSGAHVLSWRTAGCGEVLFMSGCTALESGTPIRGGIPIIFPQFGPGPMVKHGFARISSWDVVESGISEREETVLRLRFVHQPEIYTLWPHQFTLEYTVSLGESLTTSLRVSNNGESAFEFTAALHTYFCVGDIADCFVEGLEGCEFLDMLDKSRRCVERERRLRFSGMIDRRYLNTPRDLIIADSRNRRRIAIKKVGFKDAVVWNPWLEGAQGMNDLRAEDYPLMLCVEAAHCEPAITLAPDEFWIGAQMLQCTKE